MRKALYLIVVAAACTSDPATSDPPDPPGEDVFTLTVPGFRVEPGDEIFMCYYTTLPLEEARAISRYQSRMTAGSHHMILFYQDEAERPDGTLEACGGGPAGFGTRPPVWAYAAQEPEQEMRFPEGVAVPVDARQPVVVNMHYYNIGEAPIDASVTIDLHALPIGAEYQAAHAFVTFATEISVPAGESATVGGSCAVPAGAQFVVMSTHSHKYTTEARVLDGDSMVVQTRDWAHPSVGYWPDAPFLEFSSGRLDYQCDYLNDSGQTLTVGESALANEMCMAGGFFFPATADVFCVDSTVYSF